MDGTEEQRPTQEGHQSGPLSGITVIDITRVVAGPFCSMMLADLGATVIKVENPAEPDYARDFPPHIGEEPDQFSAFFAQYNRNKLGITVNLREEEGKQLLRQLVRQADVLVENFRPGTMDRLGLGYEMLREENPRLVYTAISGFGQTGPTSLKPAYDNSGQATGGLWSMNGFPDREPVRVGTIIGDLSASLYAVIGTLAALREAEASGHGQMVDISQQDSVFSLTENAVVRYTVDGEVAQPLGNDHPFVRPYGLFPCKDGYVFFGGYTDKFWRETCEIFGEPEVATDPEIDTMRKRFDSDVFEHRVKPTLEKWFEQHTKQELEDMAGTRIPLSAVKNIAEVAQDPQIVARDMVVNVEYPEGAIGMFGLPIKLSETPGDPRARAPRIGEHNDLVYGEKLGLKREYLDELREKGAI